MRLGAFGRRECEPMGLGSRYVKIRFAFTCVVDKIVALSARYERYGMDKLDSRVFRVSLTPTGKALKPQLIDISPTLIARVYKDMPMEERKQVVRLLMHINDNW